LGSWGVKDLKGESTERVDGREGAGTRLFAVAFFFADGLLVGVFRAEVFFGAVAFAFGVPAFALVVVFFVGVDFALDFAVMVGFFLAVRLDGVLGFCAVFFEAACFEEALVLTAALVFAVVVLAALALLAAFLAPALLPVFLPADAAMSASLCVLNPRRWTDRGLPSETGRARKLPEPLEVGHIVR